MAEEDGNNDNVNVQEEENQISEHENYEKYEIESDIVIFDPRGIRGSYRRVYPELNRTYEFQKLTDKDLKFVWWFSNPTSPLVLNISNNTKRATLSYHYAYGEKGKQDKKKFYQFSNNQFHDDIKSAIQKMSVLSPNDRDRAKRIVDKTFSDIEEISNLTINDFKDSAGNIDYAKFVNTKRMILDEIPSLLKIKEEGFGVTDAKGKDKDTKTGQQNISNFLNSKKDEHL